MFVFQYCYQLLVVLQKGQIRHIYISELFSMYSRNIRDSGGIAMLPHP